MLNTKQLQPTIQSVPAIPLVVANAPNFFNPEYIPIPVAIPNTVIKTLPAFFSFIFFKIFLDFIYIHLYINGKSSNKRNGIGLSWIQ